MWDETPRGRIHRRYSSLQYLTLSEWYWNSLKPMEPYRDCLSSVLGDSWEVIVREFEYGFSSARRFDIPWSSFAPQLQPLQRALEECAKSSPHWFELGQLAWQLAFAIEWAYEHT